MVAITETSDCVSYHGNEQGLLWGRNCRKEKLNRREDLGWGEGERSERMGGTRAQPVGIQVWTVTAQPASALSARSTESKRGGEGCAQAS